MDGRNLESNIRMRYDLPWMHELLCNANGSATAIDAAPILRNDDPKERGPTGLDRKNPFN
jgi:hypothetical protein